MNLDLISPEWFLSLGKVTALLVSAFVAERLMRNVLNRAALWTIVIFTLPLIVVLTLKFSILNLVPCLEDSRAVGAEISQQQVAHAAPIELSLSSVVEQSQFEPEPIHPSLTEEVTMVELVEPPVIGPEIAENKIRVPWLFVLFFFGVVLSLGTTVFSYFRYFSLTQFASSGRPLVLWQSLLRDSEKEWQLSFTSSPSAPFSIGLFRNRVLLPMDALDWSEERLLSALTHELAHLRRRDSLTRTGSIIVRSLLWFHPLVWLAHRRLVLAQEQACDQIALASGISPISYAEALLKSVRNSKYLPSQSLAMARWSQMGQRIRLALVYDGNAANSSTHLRWVSVVGIGVLGVTGFADETVEEGVVVTKSNSATRGEIHTRDGVVLAISLLPEGEKEERRVYPLGEKASHLTGYVRPEKKVTPDRVVGTSGLEKYLNPVLERGENVTLTIDSLLQNKAYELLKAKNHLGSMLVSDPRTGEILAMASWPSYDANELVPALLGESIQKLWQDKRYPLLNRSTQGAYTLGSTAHLMTALAGEYAGLENPEIHCESFVRYGPVRLADWKADRDENLRLSSALQKSCLTYFYQLANLAGGDAMQIAGELLQIGETNLVSLDSRKSHWFDDHADIAYSKETHLALSSVGQGRVEMSPLDIHAITSAIAEGTWKQPYLIANVDTPRREQSLVGQGGISRESLELIRQGMVNAVQSEGGAAQRAFVEGVVIAGKTGTARWLKDDFVAWCTAFAPADNPQYTITIALEGAPSGGKDAAPLVAEMFQFLLK